MILASLAAVASPPPVSAVDTSAEYSPLHLSSRPVPQIVGSKRILLEESNGNVRQAISAEGLHAALADTSVVEILVAGPIQLSAATFNATPAGRLVIGREVVLRGVTAEAGLHVDRAGKGIRKAPESGWLFWSKRLTFISLEIKGLLDLDFGLAPKKNADRFTLRNAERSFSSNETSNGELFFRNCTIEMDPNFGALLDFWASWTQSVDLTGISEFQTPRSASNMVLVGASPAPLFRSELRVVMIDHIMFAFRLLHHLSGGVAAQNLILWGKDDIYLLWVHSTVGIYFFDCRFTVPSESILKAEALRLEYKGPGVLGGDIIEGGDAAESLRSSVISEFQGKRQTSCQSIYKTDPTWALAAKQQGVQLPETFNRFLYGRDYAGTVNITKSGRPCLPWRDIDLPGAEDSFSGIEGNACRNPTSSGLRAQSGVWCFVDSADSSWEGSVKNVTWEEVIGGRSNWSKYDWEYCDVPACESTADGIVPAKGAEIPKCKTARLMTGPGPWNITTSYDGYSCWNWSEIPFLRHAFGRFDDNYCRNPEELGLVTDVGVSWFGWTANVEPWCFTWALLRPTRCAVPWCEAEEAAPEEVPIANSTSVNSPSGLDGRNREDESPALGEPEATGEQRPWLAVGVAGGAVAAIAALVLYAFYSWRQKKAKGGGVEATIKNIDGTLPGGFCTDLEDGSTPERDGSMPSAQAYQSLRRTHSGAKDSDTTGRIYSRSNSRSTALDEVEGCATSGGSDASFPFALQSHAVEILQQTPDSLGLVKLLGHIGSGVSSRVESCYWRDSSACCKIIKLAHVYDEAMSQKILFGVEAGLLASLCHPNIVQTYKIYHVLSEQPGSVDDGGVESIWLIQELCAGGSLASKKQEIMEREDSMRVMLKLFRQVALALRFLHEEIKVVHGDIKPENVLLKTGDNGTFSSKVADFGLSHVMHDREHYRPDKLYGDLKFMAPEAIFGNVVSPAMDIWSLGMLIFDMMSPKGIVHDATDPEAILNFLKGNRAIELPDFIPAAIRGFVKKCTNTDAEQRPSVDDAINELTTIINVMGYSSRPSSPNPRGQAVAHEGARYSRVIEYCRARYTQVNEAQYTDSASLLPRGS